MPRVLHIDLETYSEIDLKKAGVAKYAEHPSTEILCAAYLFDNERLRLWVPVEPFEFPQAAMLSRPDVDVIVQTEVPDDLREHIESGGELRAWNAAFERTVLNGTAGRKLDFPRVDIKQTVCVMHKARVAGLPGELGEAAIAAGTHRKDDAGRNVMLQLSKPRRGKVKRYTLDNSPERFKTLYSYCPDDVLAECGLDTFLPELTPAELSNYHLDQKINDRGIRVDTKTIDDVRHVLDCFRHELEKEFYDLTELAPTQREKIANWVRDNGYAKLPDMQAATIKALLEDPRGVPGDVQRALQIYSAYGSKAVSKYESIPEMLSAGERLRHMFLIYGAGPGRWSSRGVQLQNMMRPLINDVDLAIEMFQTRDLQTIKTMWMPDADPMKVAGSCVRGMLIPSEGRDILSVDFAGIESRIVAWIFDEEWKLDVFRAFDAGTGPDSYKRSAAALLRKPVEQVTKHERQAIGKTTELSFGYEGGVAALIKMAANYEVDLEELAKLAYPIIPNDVLELSAKTWQWAIEQNRTLDLPKHIYIVCDALKRVWRDAHPRIKTGWAQLKALAADAVEHPGQAFTLPNRKIMFKVEDHWLRLRLPSGRKLSYYKPKVSGERDARYDGRTVSYMGVDTETRQWKRVNAHGGRWTQNIGEGVARDLLVPAMHTLDEEGYELIGSVHDEAIMEAAPDKSLERAFEIMCTKHKWAAGLPVAVDGFRAKRYRK